MKADIDFREKDPFKSKKMYEAEKAHVLELQKKKKGEIDQATKDWYSKVIPMSQPLYEDGHNAAINHYREEKRMGDNMFDEFEAQHFIPLSREEHNFHLVKKDGDYK